MSLRRRLLLLMLLALLLAVVFYGPPRGLRSSVDPRGTAGPSAPEALARPPAPLVGEGILADYGKPEKTIRDDLAAIHQLLVNYQTLVKHPDALPLGGNAEIADALRGNGRHNHEAFLPARHPVFNARGELMDRWGTPLFFHAESHDRIAVRSAGPDRELWTADDVRLDPDHLFRTGG